jgi:hypothetical protein
MGATGATTVVVVVDVVVVDEVDVVVGVAGRGAAWSLPLAQPAASATSTATEALGIAPDANGLADHVRIGDEWERTDGRISIVAALLDQLEGE